jgi:hypothetical protein
MDFFLSKICIRIKTIKKNPATLNIAVNPLFLAVKRYGFGPDWYAGTKKASHWEA